MVEIDGERHSGAEEAQKRFTLLRLRFNSVLTQFDLFDNVITQRSENQTGVWLSGLDVASADALRLRETFFDPPPIICYLDRGTGAAIRRARTRLPGGGANPVAIIKVPRERMVGSGIASSLFHEVGHQAAALLGLVESLRPEVREMSRENPEDAPAWQLWERWISEIVADFWSVARVGVAATMGLMAVVEPAAPFRLPAGRAGSPSDAVDSREAERRYGSCPVSAAGLGAAGRISGSPTIRRTAWIRTSTTSWLCWSTPFRRW